MDSMVLLDLLRRKIAVFLQALNGLEMLLQKDLSLFDPVVTDGVKNGRIQKFEYCTELLWKTVRRFLLTVHGIETVSPKTAVKECFVIGQISGDEYATLCSMIDDRNLLSHMYREEFFEGVHSKLDMHAAVMKKIATSLETI
jgi:nucleotidyltransferase substrate binding protein (TIGR01987 family)